MSSLNALAFGEGPVLQPGENFRGYVVERLLGEGGLGSVWLARHQMLDTLFAIKILDPEIAEQQPDYVKRFVREARLATRIRHPNLVRVHDAGYDETRGVYFLVMDYVKGDTLRAAIAFTGAHAEKDAIHIILQVADVLAAAQRFGMVHRDLKPENIMLTPGGTVKLLDLGIAKIADGIDSLKTRTNTVFGTPAYISPEQALDSSSVDTRADVYSMGIILFELLCGRRPYMGKSQPEVLQQLLEPTPIPDIRTFNPDVSPNVSAVLARMCAKNKEERLVSPQEVISSFARIGYVLSPSGETEFAAEEDVASSGMVQDLIPELVKTTRKSNDLTLETQDKDVQEFLTQLRHKRFLQRMFWVATGLILILLFALVWHLAA